MRLSKAVWQPWKLDHGLWLLVQHVIVRRLFTVPASSRARSPVAPAYA